MTINHVEDSYNGKLRCFLGLPSEVQEPSGEFLLTVASESIATRIKIVCNAKCGFLVGAPKPPQLYLRGGADNTQQFRVNDVLMASCKVADARPVANISWFLGTFTMFNAYFAALF